MTDQGGICGVCSQPATDATICGSCSAQLVAELRQVPWLVEELTTTLTRQARVGDRNGPRSSETPLPYHEDASVDLDTLRGTLQVWADLIAQRRSLSTPYGTAVELARWLIMFPTEIAGHPDAADMHDQIMSVTASARRTIDRRPDLKFVGPCDGHGASQLSDDLPQGCGEDMFAHLHAKAITCRTDGCGAVYDVEQRRAWLLEAAADQLRTAKQLSDEIAWVAGLTISPKLVSMWGLRGKLTIYGPHPRDARQSQRYRLGEVVQVAIDHGLNAQHKRMEASGAA